MLGGGLGVVLSLEAAQFAKESLRQSWAHQDALVQALKDQTTAVDNLVWSLWEVQSNSSAEHAAIMRKLRVEAPPKVERPQPAKPSPVPPASPYVNR
jgi:hypothetical protein